MPVRGHELAFGSDEKLHRRVSIDGVLKKTGKLKPGSLKLQISVDRQGKDQAYSQPKPDGKFNGVYAIAASEAVKPNGFNAIEYVCVDDPNDKNPAHSLIAFVLKPGLEASQEQIALARQVLAERFTCAVNPTRPR